MSLNIIQSSIHNASALMSKNFVGAIISNDRNVITLAVSAVAACIFALIALVFIYRSYSQKAEINAKKLEGTPKQPHEGVEQSSEPILNEAGEQDPMKKIDTSNKPIEEEKPSKIPLIDGYGLLHWERLDVEQLFKALYEGKYLDLNQDKDKEAKKIIDDFGQLVQVQSKESSENRILVVYKADNFGSALTPKDWKEYQASGCHFHIRSTKSTWSGPKDCKELAISETFIKNFLKMENAGNKSGVRDLLLTVVEELKRAIDYEEKKKKQP